MAVARAARYRGANGCVKYRYDGHGLGIRRTAVATERQHFDPFRTATAEEL